jgi:ribose transport system permease protein
MTMSTTITNTNTGSSTPKVGADGVKSRRVGKLWGAIGPLVIFIVMFAIVAILVPTFIGGGTGLSIVASSAAPILLVALGQAMVLNIGSIDLSTIEYRTDLGLL